MMKKIIRKLMVACLAVGFALSTTLTPMAVSAAAPNAWNSATRIGGFDRYETAALIAQNGWPETSDSVVLSAGMNYSLIDALAAGPLAATLKAPIILTDDGQALNAVAKAELLRLKPEQAYITSGTAVIKQSVLDEIRTLGITPVELGGYDQYETSVNIAKEMAEQGANISRVVLAAGWLSPADALSIGSIAAAQGMPILATTKDNLPAAVKTYFEGNKDKIIDFNVVGGTAVVSDAAMEQLPGNAKRYAGLTKYDTNIEILKGFAKEYRNDKVFVANGETLVDALAGAPLAATYRSPVVLVNQPLDNATKEFVKLNISTDDMVALGGEAVVPAAGLNAMTSAVSYAEDNATVGSTDADEPLKLTENVKFTGDNVTVENVAADYSVYVQGNNITLNNLTVKGTVFVDPGKTGSATLDGVTAGNIVILSGAPQSVNVTRSHVTGEITISSEGDTHVVFNSVTTNGLTVQTYEIYETNEQGNQVKVGTITISGTDNNLGNMTITSMPGEFMEVNLNGEFSQPISVEGQGNVTVNLLADAMISSITSSANSLTLGGAGNYIEVIVQGGTLTAAEGTVLPSVVIATTNPSQTVTLAGNITNVKVNQGNVDLAAGTTVANMTTTGGGTIIVPPDSSIDNMDYTGPMPAVGGGGTVNGETTSSTPGDIPVGGGDPPTSGGGGGGGGGGDSDTTAPEVKSASATIGGNTVIAEKQPDGSWLVDLSGKADNEYFTEMIITADRDATEATMSVAMDATTTVTGKVVFTNGVANVNTSDLLGPEDTGEEGVSVSMLREIGITEFTAELKDAANNKEIVTIHLNLGVS